MKENLVYKIINFIFQYRHTFILKMVWFILATICTILPTYFFFVISELTKSVLIKTILLLFMFPVQLLSFVVLLFYTKYVILDNNYY